MGMSYNNYSNLVSSQSLSVVAKSQIFTKELLEFRELAKCVGRCKISNIYQIITRISGALKVCRSLQNLKHLTNIFKSRKVLSVATK